MMFAIASVSFVSQIYFLLKAKQATGIVILISLIGLLHIFALFAFVDAGASVISNNWPADVYYATRAWVVLMLVSVIAMDAAKLGILYRDTLRSFFQRGV